MTRISTPREAVEAHDDLQPLKGEAEKLANAINEFILANVATGYKFKYRVARMAAGRHKLSVQCGQSSVFETEFKQYDPSAATKRVWDHVTSLFEKAGWTVSHDSDVVTIGLNPPD